MPRNLNKKIISFQYLKFLMPTQFITPNRGGFILATVVLVMFINLVVIRRPYQHDCDSYYLSRVLDGPVSQDDPALVAWVRNQMVEPSQGPYNLNLLFSGLEEEAKTSPYSPSQDFIANHVEKIFGDDLEKRGTFLEAGAYDGEFLSNTLFLEKEYGWRGILVEANPVFFKKLLNKNRKSYAINICLNIKPYPTQEEFMIASSESEVVHTYNAKQPIEAVEQGTNLASSRLHQFKDEETPKVQELVTVQCVPVYTVVQALGLNHIDFFSLDVEHAEMGILDTIPWDKLSFTVLAIESSRKDDLVAFMTSKGYSHIASLEGDHMFVNERKTRKV